MEASVLLSLRLFSEYFMLSGNDSDEEEGSDGEVSKERKLFNDLENLSGSKFRLINHHIHPDDGSRYSCC